MTKSQNLMLLLGFGALVSFAGASVDASVLEIKNQDSDKREVKVAIEPEDGTILPNKRAVKIVLEAEEMEKVNITKDIFKSDTFSITGSVTMPSTGNKCGPLLIDTDYEIVFSKSKGGGIACTAKPLR